MLIKHNNYYDRWAEKHRRQKAEQLYHRLHLWLKKCYMRPGVFLPHAESSARALFLTLWPTFLFLHFPPALLLSLSFFHLFISSAAISSALLKTVSLTLLIPFMILHSLFILPACSIQSFASRIGSLLSHLLIRSPCKWNHRFLICCPLCSFSRLNPSPLNFLLQLNLL